MKNKHKIDALTSYRFFAAFMIVLVHANHVFFKNDVMGQLPLVAGVTLFFVLSGFILTHVYPALEKGEKGKFFLARFARLWPAHLATFLLMITVVPRRLNVATHSADYLSIVIANLSMTHAWVPFREFFFSLNSVSWSISTEFGFYLLFPFLVANLKNTWHLKLLGSFLLLVVIFGTLTALHIPVPAGEPHWAISVFTSPLVRLLEFVSGMCFFLLYKNLRENPRITPNMLTAAEVLSVLGIAGAMIYTGYGVPSLHLNPYVDAYLHSGGLVIPFAGVLITALALEKGWLAQLFNHPWLVLGGEISFAMYLVHPALLILYERFIGETPPLPADLMFILFVAALLAISYCIWRFLEAPARKFILKQGGKLLTSPQKTSPVPQSAHGDTAESA